MGTGFDAMVDASHTDQEAKLLAANLITVTQYNHRQLLRNAMQSAGFQAISTEWWHFDFGDRSQVRSTMARVL